MYRGDDAQGRPWSAEIIVKGDIAQSQGHYGKRKLLKHMVMGKFGPRASKIAKSGFPDMSLGPLSIVPSHRQLVLAVVSCP